jgi:hypothetical protein
MTPLRKAYGARAPKPCPPQPPVPRSFSKGGWQRGIRHLWHLLLLTLAVLYAIT